MSWSIRWSPSRLPTSSASTWRSTPRDSQPAGHLDLLLGGECSAQSRCRGLGALLRGQLPVHPTMERPGVTPSLARTVGRSRQPGLLDLPQHARRPNDFQTYRNPLLRARMQADGISVISNIRLSGRESVPYALAGNPRHSTVAPGLDRMYPGSSKPAPCRRGSPHRL